MDFGQPNVEIGQKMANGQPLFLALLYQTCNICNNNHCRTDNGVPVEESFYETVPTESQTLPQGRGHGLATTNTMPASPNMNKK